MSHKKGQLETLICEIANLRTENQHLRKLLSEAKLTIKLATYHSEENQRHFSRILPILDANGVKAFFNLNFDL